MYEIEEKIQTLLALLDNSSIIKNIEKNLLDIKKNKQLVEKIKLYNSNNNEKLKFEIYDYIEFKKYKENENNINLLILDINNKLKEISKDKGCIK